METANEHPNAKLAEAYAKAYAEIQNVVKDAHNPHFGSNYASLGAVIDTVKPVFAKHGLAIYQAPGEMALVGDVPVISVVSLLIHSSGQMLSIRTQVPIGKPSAQAAGSAITYARRYALAAIAGITQVDDDGEEASKPAAGKPSGADDLLARIEKCTAVGEEGSTDSTELESLRPEIVELGDNAVIKAFQAKRKQIRGRK